MNPSFRPIDAPAYFADQPIMYTEPYVMAGSLVVVPNTNGQTFPEATFWHAIDKPFEIWRMLIRLTPMDGSTPPVIIDALPPTLGRRMRMNMQVTGKNYVATKNPTLPDLAQMGLLESWEFAPRPFTLKQSEGFEIRIDTLAFPTVCAIADGADDCEPTAVDVENVRVDIAFQGFLLVLAPANARAGA